jgi:hypothetical protein
LYIGATIRDIFSEFFVAKLLGTISQNTSSKKVTSHVDIQIARDSLIQADWAADVAITVAKVAVKVLTRLFPISIVLNNLSFLSLMYLRAEEPKAHFFVRESILCEGMLIRAISVPEKNQDKRNKRINKSMVKGSMIFFISGRRVFEYTILI